MDILVKSETPHYLIITPLKTGDEISNKTWDTVNKNKHPFVWISYEGNNNIFVNTENALLEYEEMYGKVPYIIKIDNDINMDHKLLDKMYKKLELLDNIYAYVYCPFSYLLKNRKGENRKISFQKDFNETELRKANYISSNSMIKRDLLEKIGGFVKDDKYIRLLDWALWLKFLYYGYRGSLLKEGKGFTTHLNEDSISARSIEDYKVKYERVYNDFVIPLSPVPSTLTS